MKKLMLPLNLQSFKTLRQRGYHYVDKTALIQKFAVTDTYHFLSRPRRFGKSLLVSTLQHLFEGHESLFKELAIHKHWDWSETYPVIRISFNEDYKKPEDIEGDLLNQFGLIRKTLAPDLFPPPSPSAKGWLKYILHHLYHETGQRVVVLIDEYDKPILDVITDTSQAKKHQAYLRGFYGVLKGSEDYLRFVFLTGISIFSKVNLMSGLNNLRDITLNPRYASICGFTEKELDTVFAPELQGLDREEIRRWYNGYNWLGEKVYNPYSILNLLDMRTFNYWWSFNSIPKYLIDLMRKEQIAPIAFAHRSIDEPFQLMSEFDVGNIDVNALLFQSGYLTIMDESVDSNGLDYSLGYPNYEVSTSFNKLLLRNYIGDLWKTDALKTKASELASLLVKHDFARFCSHVQALFAAFSHHWYQHIKSNEYECWYASLLFMGFASHGVKVRVEEASSHGRSDMVVIHEKQVFVLEFKMAEDAKGKDAALTAGMEQIKIKGYGEHYRTNDEYEAVYLMALVFGKKERNLLEISTEELKCLT